jgi:hypothetical protein
MYLFKKETKLPGSCNRKKDSLNKKEIIRLNKSLGDSLGGGGTKSNSY